MVAPETIRKGSKVFFFDSRKEPVTVFDNINGEISVELNTPVKVDAAELFPVPLTPEVIIRSGFFKTDSYVFEHPVERVEVEIDHDGITHIHFHDYNKIVTVTSLHELQHEFWMHTKVELEYDSEIFQ